MNTPFHRLRAILREELVLYEQLLELAGQKKRLLLEAFSTELQTIVTQEEACMVSLETLEEQRLESFRETGGSAEVTLEQVLANLADDDLKTEVRTLGNRLRDCGQRIHQLNDENQRLLQQALELTRYSIQLFARIPREVTYQAPGTDRKQPGVSALIDKKI